MALASRWLVTWLSPRRLNPVWPGPVSGPPGGAVARTGLRMMPTFPLLPLKFRRADFLRYGFKAGLSDSPSCRRRSLRRGQFAAVLRVHRLPIKTLVLSRGIERAWTPPFERIIRSTPGVLAPVRVLVSRSIFT